MNARRIRRFAAVLLAAVAAMLCTAPAAVAQPYLKRDPNGGGLSSAYRPIIWTRFAKVAGQPLPIPEQWLSDEESRIAHDMVLPDTIPGIQPFDFDRAALTALLPGKPNVQAAYFRHLCEKEAGEWVFRTAENVEGFYFARPKPMAGETLTDLYGPESPNIERRMSLSAARSLSAYYIDPPRGMYRFVEAPRIPNDTYGYPHRWLAEIKEPFIRLFGLTRAPVLRPGTDRIERYADVTPLQVVGIAEPTAQYAFTWRGIRRERDREHAIAGGELIVYERVSMEILAVHRNFIFTHRNRRTGDKAAWEVGGMCEKFVSRYTPNVAQMIEHPKFVFSVLKTVEPSSTDWSK